MLFNRYYRADIDINTMQMCSGAVFSTPSEISRPLRWIALLSDLVDSDFAGSTGVHDAEGVVKMLLAGAKRYRWCLPCIRTAPIKSLNWLKGRPSGWRIRIFPA